MTVESIVDLLRVDPACSISHEPIKTWFPTIVPDDVFGFFSLTWGGSLFYHPDYPQNHAKEAQPGAQPRAGMKRAFGPDKSNLTHVSFKQPGGQGFLEKVFFPLRELGQPSGFGFS